MKAACVCLPDVQARYGQTPFAPKVPFVPGYAIIGVVDALGDGVTNVAVSDRVAGLTIIGGYAEYMLLDAKQLIAVPTTLDPAEAVALILNYLIYRKFPIPQAAQANAPLQRCQVVGNIVLLEPELL